MTLLSGGGYAFATGLNAYLPLLILALTDRISESFNLDGPYDALSSNAGILLLLLVLPLELVLDKIPRLDQYNDLLHSVVRPLAGAVAFMAVADESGEVNPWLAGFAGLVLSGVVHTWKMRARPAITKATDGLGNPFASMLEDAVSIVAATLAATVPVANVVWAPTAMSLLRHTWGRMARGESRLIKAFQPRPRA